MARTRRRTSFVHDELVHFVQNLFCQATNFWYSGTPVVVFLPAIPGITFRA